MTQARWQQLTNWPLTISALVFLVAYAWEVIAGLQGARADVCDAIIWITWAIFVVDYLVNFALSTTRWRWFYTHLLDLLIVALPALRPLRLLRLITVLVLLHRTAGTKFRGRVVIYTATAGVLLVFVAALATLDAERGAPGATITTFGNALWWAFVTITTVGDSAFSPITITGRLVSAGLMLGGIALLGVVTATFVSWIVERVAQREEADQAATRGQLNELSLRFSAIEEHIKHKTDAPEQ
jgi:voltage-gated potassium channel